jgi:hypothetical protein
LTQQQHHHRRTARRAATSQGQSFGWRLPDEAKKNISLSFYFLKEENDLQFAWRRS